MNDSLTLVSEKRLRELLKFEIELKSAREVVIASLRARASFMAINDGFYTGLIPPEMVETSQALDKYYKVVTEVANEKS